MLCKHSARCVDFLKQRVNNGAGAIACLKCSLPVPDRTNSRNGERRGRERCQGITERRNTGHYHHWADLENSNSS